MMDGFEYSERYYDDQYEYRHVTIPKDLTGRVPRTRLMREVEWRSVGVQQSAGWMHYAIHKPERHILLFKRPKGYSELDSRRKMQWSREAEDYIINANNEMQRAMMPKTRSTARQVLKENNTKLSTTVSNEQTDDAPLGVLPNLFY